MAKLSPLKPSRFDRLKPANWLSLELSGAVFICLIASLSFIWRLSKLTLSSASTSEIATKQAVLSVGPWWKTLFHLNGPYYLLLRAIFSIHHSLFYLRLSSVIISVLTTLAIYLLVSAWHGYKIAILSALVYIFNFGVLASSRQALAISVQLLISVLLLGSIALVNHRKDWLALLGLVTISSLSLYFPGELYLVLAVVVLSYTSLKETIKSITFRQQVITAALGLTLIAPLAYRLIKHYSLSQLTTWLGYNLHGKLFTQLKDYVHNFIRAPLDLFIHSSNLGPTLSLGHLPLVPIAVSVIALIGGYCYFSRLNNYRWRSLLILILIGWLSIALGQLSVFSLLPFVVIAVATGIAFLLKQWFSVFPRNPIARYGGLSLITLVILFSCFYSARSYYVAWANDPATLHAYTLKL